MKGSRFLIALLITVLGVASFSGISRTGKRTLAGDTLESTLTNTRALLLSELQNNQYWSGSFETDVSQDALILALGNRLHKLTPDLQESFVQSIFARILPDQSGWPAYTGGKADRNVTAMTLLSLRSIGIGADDPRVVLAWKWFQSEGGGKVPPYAALLLSTLGVLNTIPEISPRIFGLPTKLPIEIDQTGIPRGLLIPLIATDYFATLPNDALIVDRKSTEAWFGTVVEIGTFAKHRPDAPTERNCIFPEDSIDSSLSDIENHPDQYKNCVFYPNQAGKKLFARIGEFVHSSRPQKAIKLANFILERTIVGSDVYWSEQAVGWELQAQNPGKAWYGTLFSILGVRLLEEAQRLGLGNFQSNIDQAWTAILQWRVKNRNGILVEQLTLSGIWDTATILISYSQLQGTEWALPPEVVTASLQWLLDHAVHTPGMQSWSFDETDTSLPDIDDTANVIHALSLYASPTDARAQEAIQQGAAWITAKQNKDGGFPAWTAGASPLISDVLQMAMHVPTVGDLSQADVTGRVLFALSDASRWMNTGETSFMKPNAAACRFMRAMPKVNGTSVHLSLGHWMVNYIYSAANVLAGLISVKCEPAQQLDLVHFIVDRQQDDGGWGEGKEGYSTNRYVAASSTLSQSAVALSSLIQFYDLNRLNPEMKIDWLQVSIEKGVQFLISKSQGGRASFETDFTGVLVKGAVYARYDLLPAYTMTNALGRWKKILNKQSQ